MRASLNAYWNNQDSWIAGINAPAHVYWLVIIVKKCEHVALFSQTIHEQIYNDDLHA